MSDTHANEQRRGTVATIAFRLPKERKHLLEAISVVKGHGCLSDTGREAVDQYIDRHLHLLNAA
jgi:predicted DNA-binding protein